MDIEKHFMPMDHSHAFNEYRCFRDLLRDIILLVEEGKTEEAKHRSIDLTKSLHELSKMSEKKYRIDKLNAAARMMHEQGIPVQALRSVYGDGFRR